MQLLEYFLWKNIDDINKNKKYSFLCFIILLIQPFCYIMANKNKNKMNLFFMYILFLLLCICVFYKSNFITTISENKK